MMQPAEISLRVEGVGPGGGPLTVRAGGEIQGSVELRVMEGVELGDLVLALGWRTEGKGNRASGTGKALVLVPSGRWEAGSRGRFPFSVQVPWGPLSYGGEILQVLWELEARAELPERRGGRAGLPGGRLERRREPASLRPGLRAAISVELLPSREMREVNLGPLPLEREVLEAAKSGRSRAWLGGGITTLLLAVILGVALRWQFFGWERYGLFLVMLGGFLMTLRGVWGRLGRGKLGEPTVQLSTTDLRRGEEIRFSVGIRPERRAELRALEVILECEERVVHGSGQYRTRHRRTVYERRMVLARDQGIEAYRGFRKKGVVAIPGDAPCSFSAPDNQVVWWLRFVGDIHG